MGHEIQDKGRSDQRFENNLYAYHRRSDDKVNRRPKSLPPEYLGVITRNGIVKKSGITGIRGDYEYGNVALLYGIAENTFLPALRKIFPYMYERAIAYVILRNIQPLPMKSVRYLYEKTYFSPIGNESMSAGSISSMLSSLPHDSCNELMRYITVKGEYVLMDSTAIFSRSVNMSISELGHNAHDIHIPQINIMMLISSYLWRCFFRREYYDFRQLISCTYYQSLMRETF